MYRRVASRRERGKVVIEEIDKDRFINNILSSNIGGLSRTDASQILTELYEIEYGIFNHAGKSMTKPFSSIAMFPNEDTLTHSRLSRSIRKYVMYNIYENFHLDLNQFLNLTPAEIMLMVDIAREFNSDRGKPVAKLEEDLKSMQKELKK